MAGSFNLRLYDYCADLSCGVVPRKLDKWISVFCIKICLYSHIIKNQQIIFSYNKKTSNQYL